MSRATSSENSESSAHPAGTPHPRPAAWPGAVLVALAFVVAAALSWRKWPDILIDFGLQLYLPWKISTGSVLYRDIAYLTAGPLSQYYHALLFKCFGVSFRTVIFSNLILTAGLLCLLYRRFLAATDAWTSTLICLGIVGVFGFEQYGEIGNYNFIAPYCHEIVHGVFLAILAIALLADWLARERIRSALAAGFCAGLVFLTKPDVFLALAAAVTAAFILSAATKGRAASQKSRSRREAAQISPKNAPKAEVHQSLLTSAPTSASLPGGWQTRLGFIGRSLAAFALAATLPFLGFLFYFHQFNDWRNSLRSAGYAWAPVLHGGVSNGFYYRWCLGLDTPRAHLLRTLEQFLAVIAMVALFAFLFRRKMDSPLSRLMALGGTALVLAEASRFNWGDCGRTLPLLDLIFCALLCANYRTLSRENMKKQTYIETTGESPFSSLAPRGTSGERAGERGILEEPQTSMITPLPNPLPAPASRGEGTRAREKPIAFLLLWGIFALFLTVKMGVFCRIWHYGFILAMPAFAGAVCLLFWLLPRLLAKHGVQPALFRAAIALVFLFGGLRLFIGSQFHYRDKTIAVGAGGDKIYAAVAKLNPVGASLQAALPWMETNLPPDATLAVLPEGAMVNYLARRANPTHYLVWNPVEISMFGQDHMTAAFERHAPDYIMFIHRDGSEYGAKFFGQTPDFGLELMRWIKQNYEPVYLLGHEPLQTSLFGIQILKRRAAKL